MVKDTGRAERQEGAEVRDTVRWVLAWEAARRTMVLEGNREGEGSCGPDAADA